MKMSRMQAKRKLGETITKEYMVSTRPPMKRIKTYITEMELNNMLMQTCNKTLAHFRIEQDDDGNLLDPSTWPHLSLCPDKASPNVCMDHHLSLSVGLNISCDWDLEHDTKNSGNGALNDAKLMRFFKVMIACHNVTYGSTLSPPRAKQIQQAFREYLGWVNPKTDPWLLYWAPLIVKGLGLNIDITSDTGMQDHDLPANN